MIKNLKKTRILILIMLAVLIFSGILFQSYNSNSVEIVNLALETEENLFMRAEIIIPSKTAGGSMPLVTIGHGFKGTLNSGGARELAERLAKNGVATIRMDYNHFTDKMCIEKTNQYDLESMIEDQLLCINYMRNNYNIDDERIGLYARSMGGRVAMIMANKSLGGINYKGLALVAPAGNDIAMKHYMGGQDSWTKMKKEAKLNGFVWYQGLKLEKNWFDLFEEYNPAKDGNTYKENVLVIYNTLDNVVTPETSIECCKAYKNNILYKVTTQDGHGYEMSYENSKLKNEIMTEIVDYFITQFDV